MNYENSRSNQSALVTDWSEFHKILAEIDGFAGHEFIYKQSTASTNSDLKNDWPLHNIPQKVLVAGSQTAGRGRYDRNWIDTPGSSLLFSFTWEFSRSKFESFRFPVTLVLGSVVHRAISERVKEPQKIWLKWPNDIYCDNFKIAGILMESFFRQDSLHLVAGIGINIESISKACPTGGTEYFSGLDKAGFHSTPPLLLTSILAGWTKGMGSYDVRRMNAEYEAGCALFKARNISVQMESDKHLASGKPVRITEDGCLWIEERTRCTLIKNAHRVILK